MRKALALGPFQRLVQVRSLVGEYRDNLVQIAVGGGPGDAVITGQCVRGGAVAEPPQAQHPLPKAGQRPAVAGCTAAPPLGPQQLRNEQHQFPRAVKRGTIADHVEPSGEEELVVRPLLIDLQVRRLCHNHLLTSGPGCPAGVSGGAGGCAGTRACITRAIEDR